MQSSVDIFPILFLVGGVQGLFLAVALLTIKGGNRLANRIFAILLIVWAIPLFTAVAYRTKYILSVPHLTKVEVPLVFLYGPLFFLYVRTLTTKAPLTKRDLLHFVPFVLDVLYLSPFYLQSSDEKLAFWAARPPGPSPLRSNQEEAIGLCHIVVYAALTIRLIASHGRAIRESFSSLERINLTWVRNLLIGFCSVWAFHLVFVLSGFRVSWFMPIMGLVIVGMIFFMGFKGVTQPEIFTSEDDRRPAGPKYSKTALAPERAELYAARLAKAMDGDKVFVDSELSLPKLARNLAIPSHHLSQVINERLQQNFFEFVNGRRVEEAKRLLADPAKSHLNIAEIGFTVGFNSSSTFNAAFKGHTQTTPSRFRKLALSARTVSEPTDV